jgi:hypothetical protein
MWLQWDRDALKIYAPGVDTPETKCIFRKAAITLFGPKIGWKLSRTFPISVAAYAFGLGLALHDFFAECASPLRFPPHGFYYGVACMSIGFILAYYQVLAALKKT